MNSNSSDSDDDELDPFSNVHSGGATGYDSEMFGNDADDDLPPILEPPSTGYFHTVDENRPPPELRPVMYGDHIDDDPLSELENTKCKNSEVEPDDSEVIEIDDSDQSDKSSTTDSDDELVDVDYEANHPQKYEQLLERYGFLACKETWVYNVRNFYKKQPTRVKRLLKMHKDADGNPVEEPVEILFEKIHAERERMRKAQNVKCEVLDEGDKEDDGLLSVASLNVGKSHPKLVHVAYPGNVVNPEKAVATLGGAGTISKVHILFTFLVNLLNLHNSLLTGVIGLCFNVDI